MDSWNVVAYRGDAGLPRVNCSGPSGFNDGNRNRRTFLGDWRMTCGDTSSNGLHGRGICGVWRVHSPPCHRVVQDSVQCGAPIGHCTWFAHNIRMCHAIASDGATYSLVTQPCVTTQRMALWSSMWKQQMDWFSRPGGGTGTSKDACMSCVRNKMHHRVRHTVCWVHAVKKN